MKVIKRNYELRNLILFLVLSMVYLQAIYSLSKGESMLTLEAAKSFLKNHYLILAVNVATIYMVAKLKKHSDKLLLLCLILIAGKNFILLAATFNKLILGLNFIYLIFSFYFFVTWELEIAKASYTPQFSKRDLEKESRFHLQGKLENICTGDSYSAYITNIDDDGCFALITSSDEQTISKISPGHYKLTANYEGVEFVHEADLVSVYDRGVGLEFLKTKSTSNNQLNWSELYKVCLERGLFS